MPKIVLRWSSALSLTVTLVSTFGSVGAPRAWASNRAHGSGGPGGRSLTAGVDVSYPQCSTTLPSGQSFAIVGVNGGLANDYNSCLSSEFAYAERSSGTTKQPPAQLYLNTADPGDAVSDWPSPSQLGAFGSTSTPAGACSFASGSSGPGADSPGCAYIYGYDMVGGITYQTGGAESKVIGDLAAFNAATTSELYDYTTWLDVETANSWQGSSSANGIAMNVADLQGVVASIDAAANFAGVAAPPVGVYSTGSQWNTITGTPGPAGAGLWDLPDWIPGARTVSQAKSNCSATAFTGGGVAVTQWVATVDNDYSCIG